MYRQDRISTKSRQEPFDVLGSWQFDGSNDMIMGKLLYDGRNTLTLHVMRTPNIGLQEIERMLQAAPHVTRAVGVLETGESAVLENLRIRSTTSSAPPAVHSSSYRIGCAFVGDLVADTDKFNKISTKFPVLLTWMNFNSISSNISEDAITVEYKIPKGPTFSVKDMTLDIQHSYAIEHTESPPDTHVQRSVAIAIGYKTPVPLDELCKKVMRFGYLLMLATNTHMPPTSIMIGTGESWMGLFGKYYSVEAGHTLDLDYFRFLYTDVQDRFEKMIEDWFEFYEQHEKSLDLYFTTWINRHNISVEIEFLRAVQSLEAFHRAEHRSRLNLKDRLCALLERCNMLDPSTSKKDFVDAVVKARDYHAHGYIEEYESSMPSDADLFKMTRRLNLLMTVHLIDALTIPAALKQRIISKEIQRVRRA